MAVRSALETYLGGVDGEAATLVKALDAAIRKAHRGFDVAIKYRILMYALNADWRHWVCAVDVTKRGVALRFLYGILLSDPRRVLRPGTSVLMTWDIPRGEKVDRQAVEEYIREAVARYPDYRANTGQILAEARQQASGSR